MQRDQLSLPMQDATAEEVLLQRMECGVPEELRYDCIESS